MRALFPFCKRMSFALDRLDLKLRPYLDFENGFFIEAGANDGVNQSNTLYFEKYLGWKGLLVEPVPDLARSCRVNRPKCIVENCALVAADYAGDTVEMNYCNLMSIVEGAVESELQSKHLESGRRFLAGDDSTYRVTVPARTLSAVMESHGVGRVDLLSLDVEGYETQVLRGIDFERHRIENMLIEVHDREAVEAVIGPFYRPVAILNIEEPYSDILYRRR